jgi:hypothetical protein
MVILVLFQENYKKLFFLNTVTKKINKFKIRPKNSNLLYKINRNENYFYSNKYINFLRMLIFN